MKPHEGRRACRHYVSWPARVRAVDEARWHICHVVNLSVTGVLLRMDRRYRIGEQVEVEIDFLAKPECTTVVTGVGYIVRMDGLIPGGAAVQFLVECGLSRRTGDAIERGGRDARL
jgi:Tfp pilus assembly protein PilZ